MSSTEFDIRFTNLMTKNILNKLNGSHNSLSRFESRDKPSRTIIIGNLGDKSKDYSSEDPVGNRRTASSVKNNSLSIKFLVSEDDENIVVTPKLSIFYKVYPSFSEQMEYWNINRDKIKDKMDIASIWKRKDIEFEDVNFHLNEDQEEFLDFRDVISSIRKDPEMSFKGSRIISIETLKNEDTFQKKIEEYKNGNLYDFKWICRVSTHIEEFKQEGNTYKLVEISLINDTKEDFYETFLFNCHLDIHLDEISLIPFKYSYEYENYPQYYESQFRCLNCHAKHIEGNLIETRHYSKFYQDKKVPRSSIDNLEMKFSSLSENSGIELLEKLYESMENYLNECNKSPEDNDEYLDEIENFEQMKERFKEGIETLKDDENAFRSFKLMNKVFLNVSGEKYTSWRLFQIVFIVSQISDVIKKEENKDKICEVLHVMTGGGKSEAYFGIVIFLAYFDRINGKKFGTTAITKFPLRMLSIQQLQRIADLFIHAEEIRKEENIDGEPFSVAYFVGNNKEFPRNTTEIIQKLKKDKANGKENIGKIIDKCPVCDAEGNVVILDYKEDEEYIFHKCKACDREYKLFFTDEEIYRYIPTFIVSTVDKWAGIASNRRVKNIFGAKISECPKHGFVPFNDKCEVNIDDYCKEIPNKVDLDFKTGPRLIIQDEMHLIKEGFGTIDSHFESLIETIQKEICGYGFKNIAMTATITGAKKQIENLYNKEIRIFPSKLKDSNGNEFFFIKEKYDEDKYVPQRQIIGLKPNFRDNQYASLLTLRYISDFINYVESNLSEFSSEHGFESEYLTNTVKNYKSMLSYHNKKGDVHSINYYLETVTNSKLEKYKINPYVLTGENSLEDIKNVISIVKTFYDVPNNFEELVTVFATSLVSHGVDLDEWNIMLFQGMPRSTSEYIQALSRVGRKHIGIVFLWFYPNKPRDLSFYQNFYDYHKIIQHKVEDVPISRWAKLGFKQTFTSVFTASILNYLSDDLKRPIYKVPQVNEVFSDISNKAKLIEFIKKAYVLNDSDISRAGSKYFDDNIETEVEVRLNKLSEYKGSNSNMNFFPNALQDNSDKYFKTQFGMRGIQDEVILALSKYDLDFIKNHEA